MDISAFHSMGGAAHPTEDVAVTAPGIAAVFDGVPPIHTDPYPNPSPGAAAARRGAEAAVSAYEAQVAKTSERLARGLLVVANRAIREYNHETRRIADSTAAAVGAVMVIQDGRLYAAQINDCEVRVLDSQGNMAFRLWSDNSNLKAYLAFLRHYRRPFAAGSSQERQFVRRKLFNTRSFHGGRPVQFGALTGEEAAEEFICSGSFELAPGMTAVVHSDGFTPLLDRSEFCDLLVNGDETDVEKSIRELERRGGHFGREKTLVVARI